MFSPCSAQTYWLVVLSLSGQGEKLSQLVEGDYYYGLYDDFTPHNTPHSRWSGVLPMFSNLGREV